MILAERNDVKRAFIYVFYDPEGIADGYVEKMLSSLREVSSHTLLVVNGDIREECLSALRPYCDDVLIRENEGYDVTAYIKGLERLGDSSLYDEVILMNSTLYGPFYPLTEMLGEMDRRDADFWGLIAHPEDRTTSIASSCYSYIPKHLQSYFIALRSSLLQSGAFRDFISSLPPIRGYDDARGYFEISFTPRMEEAGFTWDVYADTSRWDSFGINAVMYMPYALIREERFPFSKQKAFSFGSDEMTALFSQRKLLYWLDEKGLYDVSLITENLARTQDLNDVRSMSALNFVLDPASPAEELSCGCAFFIDPGSSGSLLTEDLPGGSAVFINHEGALSGDGDLMQNIKKALSEDPCLLEGRRYICFMDLSRMPDIPRGWDAGMFMEMAVENMAASAGYVSRVAELFEKPLRLGWLDAQKLRSGTHTVLWPESDDGLRKTCFWARKEVFLRFIGGSTVSEALKAERRLLGSVMSTDFAGREISSWDHFIGRYGKARKRYLETKKTVKKLLPSKAVGYLIKLLKK